MEQQEQESKLSRAEFWQRAAAFSFGLWALAIPIGVSMVKGIVSDAAYQQAEFIKQFNTYILAMERRVTLIEERQSTTIQHLQRHDSRLDDLEGRRNGK